MRRSSPTFGGARQFTDKTKNLPPHPHGGRFFGNKKSTRRDSNPRPSPWQGDTPPLSHSCVCPALLAGAMWIVHYKRSFVNPLFFIFRKILFAAFSSANVRRRNRRETGLILAKAQPLSRGCALFLFCYRSLFRSAFTGALARFASTMRYITSAKTRSMMNPPMYSTVCSSDVCGDLILLFGDFLSA